MASRPDNICMLLERAHKMGLSLTSLSEELGVDTSTIGGWKAGRHAASPKLLEVVEKRARALERCRTIDFDFLDALGVKESVIAQRLGISRQALHRQKTKGIPANRIEDILTIVRSIGRELRQIVKSARRV